MTEQTAPQPAKPATDGRITAQFPYGQHIELYCVNHPNKRWSTKNIQCIGARSIFYNLHEVGEMGPECECDITALRALHHADKPESTDE